MSARVVIDDHSQLLSKGNLEHNELDQVVLEGTIPEGRVIQLASKVLDNTFEKDVTINGNLVVMGDATQLDITTMSVEDVVIFLGQGSTSEVSAGDRGLVFAIKDDDNLSFYWDHDQNEFRLARVAMEMTGNATPDVFPEDPSYQPFRLGNLISEGDIEATGKVSASTLEVSDTGMIPSLTVDSLISNISAACAEITAENITATGNISSDKLFADYAEVIDVCVNNSLVTEIFSASTATVTGDTSVGGNLHVKSLMTLGDEQFLIAGQGIELIEDPETGQIEINSPIGGKRKFFVEIEGHLEVGDVLSIPELSPEDYIYDDDFWDVFVNGVLQVPGEDNDFMVDNDLHISFSFDLEENDIVVVSLMH
jgi:hypothetical protein